MRRYEYGEFFYSERVVERPIFFRDTQNDEPYRPSYSEVFREFIDSVNIIKEPSRAWALLGFAVHAATFCSFLAFFIYCLSLKNLLLLFLLTFYQANIFGTLWQHRYCNHHSFDFQSPMVNRLFLWVNPLVVREDIHVIAHYIHHARCDRNGDPHGPHLGRIGNYLAEESYQKLNRNISAETYATVTESLEHVGFLIQSYEAFRKSGYVENPWHVAARKFVSQSLHGGLFFCLGGISLLVIWFASVFMMSFIRRDFNWKGHGGRTTVTCHRPIELGVGHSVNNLVAGLFSAEWHESHHRHPDLANNALLPGQVDLVFQMIRLLKKIGLVRSYREMPKTV